MIVKSPEDKVTLIKTEFTINYQPFDLMTQTLSEQSRGYRCTFDIHDYRVIFINLFFYQYSFITVYFFIFFIIILTINTNS